MVEHTGMLPVPAELQSPHVNSSLKSGEGAAPSGESSSPLLGDRSGMGTGSPWSHVSPLTWCLEVKVQLEPGPAPSWKHAEQQRTAKLRLCLHSRRFPVQCGENQTAELRGCTLSEGALLNWSSCVRTWLKKHSGENTHWFTDDKVYLKQFLVVFIHKFFWQFT